MYSGIAYAVRTALTLNEPTLSLHKLIQPRCGWSCRGVGRRLLSLVRPPRGRPQAAPAGPSVDARDLDVRRAHFGEHIRHRKLQRNRNRQNRYRHRMKPEPVKPIEYKNRDNRICGLYENRENRICGFGTIKETVCNRTQPEVS